MLDKFEFWRRFGKMASGLSGNTQTSGSCPGDQQMIDHICCSMLKGWCYFPVVKWLGNVFPCVLYAFVDVSPPSMFGINKSRCLHDIPWLYKNAVISRSKCWPSNFDLWNMQLYPMSGSDCKSIPTCLGCWKVKCGLATLSHRRTELGSSAISSSSARTCWAPRWPRRWWVNCWALRAINGYPSLHLWHLDTNGAVDQVILKRSSQHSKHKAGLNVQYLLFISLSFSISTWWHILMMLYNRIN